MQASDYAIDLCQCLSAASEATELGVRVRYVARARSLVSRLRNEVSRLESLVISAEIEMVRLSEEANQ